MNRSRIAKLICLALVGALVLAAWGSAQAAPLVHIIMEGRRAGEGANAWRSHIGLPGDAIRAGDRIEYRLRLQMAPVGTSNTQREPATGNVVTTTIHSLNPTLDGMNSLFLALRQAPSDPIQVSLFRGPIQLDDVTGEMRDYQTDFLLAGWRAGTGAYGGTFAPRAGTPYNDLIDIRPVRAAGSFAGTTIATVGTSADNSDPALADVGDFIVMTDGLFGTIRPMWGGATSGGGRVNAVAADSPPFFVTNDTQANSADPMVGFTPLTLGVPEPSTFVLAGLGLLGLVAATRRRRRTTGRRCTSLVPTLSVGTNVLMSRSAASARRGES